MGIETIARPTSQALHVLLAPARWLERARGRWRLALMALYLVVGAMLWWRMSLMHLPDVGDPFDVEAASHVDVPDKANAYILYKQAVPLLHDLPVADLKKLPSPPSWKAAPPEIRQWVEANREAMELIRQGSERPASVFHQPGDVTIGSLMDVPQEIYRFARFAPLEASRLAEGGDLVGAWQWLRASLRASRLVASHGTVIQSLIGSAMLQLSSGPALSFATDPRVNAPLLRQALRDVVACDPLAPRVSDLLKVEYMALLKGLDGRELDRDQVPLDPKLWYSELPEASRIDFWLRREPQRSRRVLHLVYANWLVACDLPPGQRPPILNGEVELFDVGPTAPALARVLPTGELVSWYRSTRLTYAFLGSLSMLLQKNDRDRAIFAALKFRLAERLYVLEHGRPPATLGHLLGPDLPRLPEGYSPSDPSSLAPVP